MENNQQDTINFLAKTFCDLGISWFDDHDIFDSEIANIIISKKDVLTKLKAITRTNKFLCSSECEKKHYVTLTIYSNIEAIMKPNLHSVTIWTKDVMKQLAPAILQYFLFEVGKLSAKYRDIFAREEMIKNFNLQPITYYELFRHVKQEYRTNHEFRDKLAQVLGSFSNSFVQDLSGVIRNRVKKINHQKLAPFVSQPILSHRPKSVNKVAVHKKTINPNKMCTARKASHPNM